MFQEQSGRIKKKSSLISSSSCRNARRFPKHKSNQQNSISKHLKCSSPNKNKLRLSWMKSTSLFSSISSKRSWFSHNRNRKFWKKSRSTTWTTKSSSSKKWAKVIWSTRKIISATRFPNHNTSTMSTWGSGTTKTLPKITMTGTRSSMTDSTLTTSKMTASIY